MSTMFYHCFQMSKGIYKKSKKKHLWMRAKWWFKKTRLQTGLPSHHESSKNWQTFSVTFCSYTGFFHNFQQHLVCPCVPHFGSSGMLFRHRWLPLPGKRSEQLLGHLLSSIRSNDRSSSQTGNQPSKCTLQPNQIKKKYEWSFVTPIE